MSDATFQEFVLGAAIKVIEGAGDTLPEGATYQEAVIQASAVIIAGGGGGGGGATDSQVADFISDEGSDSHAAVLAIIQAAGIDDEQLAELIANDDSDSYEAVFDVAKVAGFLAAGEYLSSEANNQTWTIDGSGSPVATGFPLSIAGIARRVEFDGPGRLRLYATEADRDADIARAPGTDPAPNAGVLLDFVATGAGVYTLSPPIYFWTDEGGDIAATVNGPASASLTITVRYQRTQG